MLRKKTYIILTLQTSNCKLFYVFLSRKGFAHCFVAQKTFCALKLPFQKFRLFGPLARIWKGGGSDDRLKVEIHVRSSTDPIHQPHCGQLFNKSSSCHHSLHRSGSFAYSQTLFFTLPPCRGTMTIIIIRIMTINDDDNQGMMEQHCPSVWYLMMIEE